MRISDWSSDVCSSDLARSGNCRRSSPCSAGRKGAGRWQGRGGPILARRVDGHGRVDARHEVDRRYGRRRNDRSEEHTSELQSLMRISYAVICLKKKTSIRKEITTYMTQQYSHNV